MVQTGCESEKQEPATHWTPTTSKSVPSPDSTVSVQAPSGGLATGSGGLSVEDGGSMAGAGSTVPTEICGDGRIDGDEQCETGLGLNATCKSLGKGIGKLICNASCRYDTSGCVADPTTLFTVNVEISSAIRTVGIVTWSISIPINEAYIEFGLDTNYGMQAPVDLSDPDYRTLLLGMKGEMDYHFRVVAKDDNKEYKSSDYTITTGPVTNLAYVREMNVFNENARARGFYVTSVWQSAQVVTVGGARGLAIIVDEDGDIVWWWVASHLGNLSSSRISYDGKNMWMVGIGEEGLERVTMDGLDSQHYAVRASHDITPVTGDVIAFIAEEWYTCGATIEEITPEGTTTVVFDTTQVLQGNCHGNAIRYNEKMGLYSYSDMMQPDVLIIDRATGNLVHQLRNFDSYWNGRQHGHHYFGNTFLVFINDFNYPQEYSIDVITRQLTEKWSYQTTLFSTLLGDVQRLANGNTTVTYSIPGRLHEIDTTQNLVMEMVFNATIGYSSWRRSLYGPPDDLMME